MVIYYSYLLSLLFLLLMTHWVNAASLRFYVRTPSKLSLDHHHSPFIVNDDLATSEPILLRRRPLLSSNERRKRWSREEDHDEVEIPVEESAVENEFKTSQHHANDILPLHSTFTKEQSTIDSVPINFDEHATIMSTASASNYPLLRQDMIEINDQTTTVSLNDDNLESYKTSVEQPIESNDYSTTINNQYPSTASNDIILNDSTESKILSANVTGINQVTSNENNESITSIVDSLTTISNMNNETETSPNSIEPDLNQEKSSIAPQINLSTVTQPYESDISSASFLNYTTISSSDIDDQPTTIVSGYDTKITNDSIDTTIISHTTQYGTTSINEEIINTTIVSNMAQDERTTVQQEIYDTTRIPEIIQTDTTMITMDEDEYVNETASSSSLETTAMPSCDISCQCSQKCPYGFETNNNTCQCDPPCKNYQCFGDDECTVTDNGQPLCQSKNGTEHDRPIRCYQPRDAGYHDTNIRYHNRWYYDPNQDTCHLFVYRGLGGNENNFQTLHECHLECITCAPAPDQGNCLGRIPMWYYDYKQNQCLQFDYSGCKGNDNKFFRKQQCIDTCVTRILNL